MFDELAVWMSSPGNALLLSGGTFLLGAFIGNLLTRDWDRAKEHNAAVMPLKAKLMVEIENVSLFGRCFDMTEMHHIAQMMSRRKSRRFYSAIREYEQARKNHVVQDEAGQPYYLRTDHVEAALLRLVSFLERRG